MEDDLSQTSRRLHRVAAAGPRSESRSSTHTRRTPPSSSNNSSSTHLPKSHQSARGTSAVSSLLQERLRERKVESARINSRQASDAGDRAIQSSPVRAPSVRDERRPSSSGTGVGTKTLGVKQVEEQVSTLHKQNFDLKLEVHHRRERQATLEQQLEAAEKRLQDQSELQEVNEQLLAELEKRDQAVEEAVSIICNLEDRIARLLQEREVVRNFDADYKTTEHIEGADLTSSLSQALVKSNVKSIMRMPSFLSEQSEGTEALRSLYIPSSVSVSDVGLPKLQEEHDGLNSPRLSVLSESSFVSVYGDKELRLEGQKPDHTEARRHRTTSSVEKWIDDRATSTKVAHPRQTSPARRTDKYLSIDDVIVSPLQRMEKLRRQMEQQHASVVSWQYGAADPQRRARDALRRVRTDGVAKEPNHALPPTPDTISTSTLRHYQLSSEQLEPQSVTTGNLSHAGVLARTKSRLSLRPHSAGETITSRRDGHGWDTQDDALSISSGGTAESFDQPSLRQPLSKLNPPPSLFDFSSNIHEWGQSMMLNDAPKYYPSASSMRYQSLRNRRASGYEPRTDDTARPSLQRISTDETPRKARNPRETTDTTIHNDLSPDPPDRRSSLQANTRVRKPSSSHQSSLFMPSESSNSNTLMRNNSKTKKPGRLGFLGWAADERLEDKNDRELRERENDRQRATPPPIMRNRNTTWRPASSGGERGSSYGGVSTGPELSSRKRPHASASGPGTGAGRSRGVGVGMGLDGAGDVVEGAIASIASNGSASASANGSGYGNVKTNRLSIDISSLSKGADDMLLGAEANPASAGATGKKRWFGMGSLGKRR